MQSPSRSAPLIDAHAHIAPDVSPAQVRALGDTITVAMTRTISEARFVARKREPNLIWALGTHPGVADALGEFDEATFRRAVDYFAVVGEVGLDRRGDRDRQHEVFETVLRVCRDQPVLLSIHSTGRVRQVLDLLTENPHRGAVLHWFTGSEKELAEAVALGCWFSVNAAMSPDLVRAIPVDRVITETDFPSSRAKTRARRPGDVAPALDVLREAFRDEGTRERVASNFRNLLLQTGAHERLSPMARSRLAL